MALKVQPFAGDPLIVLDLPGGLKREILMAVISRHTPDQCRARCLSKDCGGRGMIRVGVCTSDVAQFVTHASQQRLDVRGNRWPGSTITRSSSPTT